MPTEEDELRDLAEMVREGERVLDIQGESFQQQDDKSEQAMALGLASLGGLFALATLVGERLLSAFDLLAWSGIAAAGPTNLLALGLFIDAYIGVGPMRGRRAVVPSLPWLFEKAISPDWTLAGHYRSLLSDFPRCFEANNRSIERKLGRELGPDAALLVHRTRGYRLP